LLKLNLGPAAKYTYADEFAAIYTDDADTESIEKQRWEGGFEFVAQLDWPITEDILFKSNLTTFTDAERFSTDINFDNILTAKVNSWLNFNIQGQLIYDDDDVSPRPVARSHSHRFELHTLLITTQYFLDFLEGELRQFPL
jgi:helix-turn-helix protein